MKKNVFLLLALMAVALNLVAQTPSQSEVEAMMKEAERQLNEALEQLSPEDKKTAEEAMAKAKADVANMKSPMPSDIKVEIPKRQTNLLTKIPQLSGETQYNSYLTKLITQTKTSIPKNIRDAVESIISKYQSDKTTLNNIPPLLFMQKNPKAAVYAALRVTEMDKNSFLAQNNLAVILHQTGYPQHALPILEYQITKNPLSILYNNAGQCYLSLGEEKKAEEYFAICLKTDPNNHEAHCGTALILINQDKIPQAIPHVEKAMRLGYSPTLDKLVSGKNITLDYDKLKPHVPEYFNPNKYKPPHSAKTLTEVKPVLEERQEIEDLMYAWGDKQREIDEKHAAKIANETVMRMSQRTVGLVGNTPFSGKALFMLLQLQKQTLDMALSGFTTTDSKEIETAKSMHEDLEGKIEKRYKEESFESRYEECLMQREETEIYLKESAALYDMKVQKTVFKYYDITNQQLYWNKFLLNHDGYEHMFYGVASELFVHLNDYKKFQLLDKPLWVVENCEKILANPPQKKVEVEESPDPNCPFRMKFFLGLANGKMDCKGWEIEGGELVVLGIQKDYRTGELTLAFGLGASAGIAVGALGAKGQMYFKFDSDYSPVDCGAVFEAGAEAAAGPVVIEEKATATIGMVSGIHVVGVAAGQETAIFTLEP